MNPERWQNPAEAKERHGLETLQAFIAEKARELRENEAVPLDTEGRIVMSAYDGVYPREERARDDATVAELHKKWYDKLTPQQIAEKKLESDGEKLELLKTAIFEKNIGSKFIVARTSEYDDGVNKVDNILFDPKTGNVVCALDDVAAMGGPVYEEKQAKVFSLNIDKSGATIKYGLKLDDEKKLALGGAEKVPIFYLALPKTLLLKGVENFSRSPEPTEFERGLFKYFIDAIKFQISRYEPVKSSGASIDGTIRERIDSLKTALGGLEKAATKK